MVFPFNIFFGFEIITRSIRIVLKFLFNIPVTVVFVVIFFLVSRSPARGERTRGGDA